MNDCHNVACQDPSNEKRNANDASLTDRSSTMSTTGKPENSELCEPKTPLWFTFLGVGLLLSAVISAIAINVHESTVQAEQTQPLPEQQPLEPTDGIRGELQKNVDNE